MIVLVNGVTRGLGPAQESASIHITSRQDRPPLQIISFEVTSVIGPSYLMEDGQDNERRASHTHRWVTHACQVALVYTIDMNALENRMCLSGCGQERDDEG